MKTITLLLGLIVLSSVSLYGQQDAQYTQYMYNSSMINPAYAGSRDALSVFALYRNQWVGLEGAPTTMNLSVNTPIGEKGLGMGLNVVNDKIGITNETNISLDVSYTIETSDTYKLGFGLRGNGNFISNDFNKLNLYNPNDPSFLNAASSQFGLNFGVGLFFYSDKTYFGLSVPALLDKDAYVATKESEVFVQKRRHFYFTAGHVFDLGESLKFKPALMTKLVEGAPLQVDLSGNFMIDDKFVVGAAYRWDAAVSAMVGMQVSDSWFIGYSYDYETTNLSKYNSGSHEIFIRFEVFKNNKIISPRFF